MFWFFLIFWCGLFLFEIDLCLVISINLLLILIELIRPIFVDILMVIIGCIQISWRVHLMRMLDGLMNSLNTEHILLISLDWTLMRLLLVLWELMLRWNLVVLLVLITGFLFGCGVLSHFLPIIFIFFKAWLHRIDGWISPNHIR